MSVQERIDELFALRPDEFTEARDALANQLRAAGDVDGAATVSKLRRPTVAAWALNQLARHQRGNLQRLRESGAELARQQRRALSGLDPSGLRGAQERRRQITDQLVAYALDVLRAAGVTPEPHANSVRGGLDAAALDAESAKAVVEGRLSRPPQPPSGFGPLSARSAVDSQSPPPAPDTDRPRQRLALARERLQAAQGEAQARRAEADDAAKDAQRAAEQVRRLQREVSLARQHQARAGERAQAAAKRADAAQATVARRQNEVAQAEADLTAGA
ncbi:MAG: hypothetical protein M3276_00615 [Actinomycetota bacterium]|nr:hypothetical protein [Actinomycetota bacterium]